MLYRRRMTVPFSDTDASGRTHFTATMRWVEVAEHDVLRRALPESATAFPRVKVTTQFRLPTRFADELDVELHGLTIGRSSVTFSWEVRRDGELCASVELVAVYVSADDRPTAVPEQLRQWADRAAVS